MIDGLLDLPSHLRTRLASALESGTSGRAAFQPLRCGRSRDYRGRARTSSGLDADLERLGIGVRARRSLDSTVEEATSRVPRPDLVWSGPEVPGLHARDTRRVYEELLGSAERSVWASTYAFFDGPRAFEVLARRMDATPTLRVTLLLNIQRKRGDTTAAEQLVRRFADRFWKTDWPGSSRPHVYYDPRALDAPGGVLHAKAVVADDEAVFVTSANLTEAALDRNIELGLLVRDRALAASVSSHFLGLIDRGLLRPCRLFFFKGGGVEMFALGRGGRAFKGAPQKTTRAGTGTKSTARIDRANVSGASEGSSAR